MYKKVLVTGGSGLVGSAIASIIQDDCPTDEQWVFCGSKDANLW